MNGISLSKISLELWIAFFLMCIGIGSYMMVRALMERITRASENQSMEKTTNE